jgi:hypothetical protein
MDIKDIHGKILHTSTKETLKEALEDAVLMGVNLREANLREANLVEASLRGANLVEANLVGANLREASLRGARLVGANLMGANLVGANLEEANLREANLVGANLVGAKDICPTTVAKLTIVHEGQMIGWKKCADDVLVKLLIPAEARRSNATARKCRAEFVVVLDVLGGEVGTSMYDATVKYRRGETVRANKWEANRWIECGGGIHFFITREEAEAFSL